MRSELPMGPEHKLMKMGATIVNWNFRACLHPIVIAAIAASVVGCVAAYAPELAPAMEPVSYKRDIKPLLESNCYKCHGPDVRIPSGRLRLDSRDSLLKGGRSGLPAVVPGSSFDSPLAIAISGGDDEMWRAMPPRDQPLDRSEIDLIRRWIDQGALFDSE
jgi:hypothetical protein